MDVGFIGLGVMGRAMARNLAKAGHRVRAWNRSATTVEGVEIVPLPREAFAAEAVFTMLSDDRAIREVVPDGGLLGDARPGTVHIVTATVSLAFVAELAAAHRAVGIGYVAAPVFGRPDVAQAAQLVVLAAGESAAVDRVQPLFDAIGRKTVRLGEEPRAANAAKLAGNMMIAMAIEAMAEATALVARNGLAPRDFLDLMIDAQFSGSRAYQSYGAKIASGDFEPGFRMNLGLKDLRLAAAAASETGLPLPMLDAVHRQMAAAVEAGLGDRDWSAVAQHLRPEASGGSAEKA